MWPSIPTSDFLQKIILQFQWELVKMDALGHETEKPRLGLATLAPSSLPCVKEPSHPSGLVAAGSPSAAQPLEAELSSLRRLFRIVALIGASRSRDWGGLSCSTICRDALRVRGVFSKGTLRWRRYYLLKMTGQVVARVPGLPTLLENSLANPSCPSTWGESVSQWVYTGLWTHTHVHAHMYMYTSFLFALQQVWITLEYFSFVVWVFC